MTIAEFNKLALDLGVTTQTLRNHGVKPRHTVAENEAAFDAWMLEVHGEEGRLWAKRVQLREAKRGLNNGS